MLSEEVIPKDEGQPDEDCSVERREGDRSLMASAPETSDFLLCEGLYFPPA